MLEMPGLGCGFVAMPITKDRCRLHSKDNYEKGLGKKRKGTLVKEDTTGKKWRTAASLDGEDVKRKGGFKIGNSPRKRQKTGTAGEKIGNTIDFFDELPDDLVICILCKLSSLATTPSDLINVLLTCKKLNRLILHPLVLSKTAPKSLAITAKNWCPSAHRFLKQCADVGNLEASYILGMIRFYCLESRWSGMSLMAKAAIGSHAGALYSLAVIQFNGSGGSKNKKDLHAGVILCAHAASLGHIDAIRELGHCLQDGYGIPKNVMEGRRYLINANARELTSVLSSKSPSWLRWHNIGHPDRHLAEGTESSLLSDFGCMVPAPEPHPANRFLVEWFGSRWSEPKREGLLRLCSHVGCGRPETRRHEFRRCSLCGMVNYCSRACQAFDWKLRHKAECVPLQGLHGDGAAVAAPADGGPLE